MKMLTLTAAVIFVLSLSAFAQRPCTLGLSSAPVIRGLSLGMPKADVERIFGRTATDDTVTVSLFEGRIVGPPVKLDMDRLEYISASFIDDRLADLMLTYDRSGRFESSREFAEALADQFSLPRESWVLMGPRASNIMCTGFSITTYDSTLTIKDEIAAAKAEAKRKADQKAFKF